MSNSIPSPPIETVTPASPDDLASILDSIEADQERDRQAPRVARIAQRVRREVRLAYIRARRFVSGH